MDFRTVTIENQEFALGLMWQTLEASSDHKKEIQSKAEKYGQDFYVVRNTAIRQVGYAKKEDKAKSGLLSLAAALSKSAQEEGVESNWIGAFELEDGSYYYIAIRDDVFLPGSDTIGTKEEIRRLLDNDYGRGQWDEIYAPEDYGIYGAKQKALVEILPRKDNGKIRVYSWWKIRPVKFSVDWRIFAATGLLLIGAIAAYVMWQKHLEEEMRIEAARKAAIQRELRLRQLQENPMSLPHPWAKMPVSSFVIQTCMDNISRHQKWSSGWLLGGSNAGIECDATGMTMFLTRSKSTNSRLLSVYPEAVIDAQNEQATVQMKFDGIPVLHDEKQMPKRMLHDFISYFQGMGIKPTLTSVPYVPPKPEKDTQDLPQPVPDWDAYTFKFSANLSPQYMGALLSLPGVRVTKITYKASVSSVLWGVEGSLYTEK